ncbi:hypothetical protein C7M84_017021 [Penaeus vannamei]|uniref:Uncharacterized protein n=1 Tax=Penaeus vannamei TaxID=6689 RepID=A0A423SLH0_PENVA|nr:hypothetical protein C7M84_017021 [Penaeus vannamei]
MKGDLDLTPTHTLGSPPSPKSLRRTRRRQPEAPRQEHAGDARETFLRPRKQGRVESSEGHTAVPRKPPLLRRDTPLHLPLPPLALPLFPPSLLTNPRQESHLANHIIPSLPHPPTSSKGSSFPRSSKSSLPPSRTLSLAPDIVPFILAISINPLTPPKPRGHSYSPGGLHADLKLHREERVARGAREGERGGPEPADQPKTDSRINQSQTPPPNRTCPPLLPPSPTKPRPGPSRRRRPTATPPCPLGLLSNAERGRGRLQALLARVVPPLSQCLDFTLYVCGTSPPAAPLLHTARLGILVNKSLRPPFPFALATDCAFAFHHHLSLIHSLQPPHHSTPPFPLFSSSLRPIPPPPSRLASRPLPSSPAEAFSRSRWRCQGGSTGTSRRITKASAPLTYLPGKRTPNYATSTHLPAFTGKPQIPHIAAPARHNHDYFL